MFQGNTTLSTNQTSEEQLRSIREAYNRDRSQMTLMLAHTLSISEVQIMQALNGEAVHELDFSRWEEIVRALEELGNVHVIVSNGAVTIEVFGQFGRFTANDGFLNIRTKSLDMHIRSWELASVFAFRKPSHLDGHESLSFQFFDQRGNAAFKVFLNFGGREPSPDLVKTYQAIIEQFKARNIQNA